MNTRFLNYALTVLAVTATLPALAPDAGATCLPPVGICTADCVAPAVARICTTQVCQSAPQACQACLPSSLCADPCNLSKVLAGAPCATAPDPCNLVPAVATPINCNHPPACLEQAGAAPSSPWCARGAAGCVAVGVLALVGYNPALDARVNSALGMPATNSYGDTTALSVSRSDASPQVSSSSSSAHQVDQAVAPGLVNAGVVDSSCASSVTSTAAGPVANACGSADVTNFGINLQSIGQNVVLSGSILRENGCSSKIGASRSGGESANVVALCGVVLSTPVCTTYSAAPNTVIPFGAVTLILNGQEASACNVNTGYALRVIARDPATPGRDADIFVGYVSTAAC